MIDHIYLDGSYTRQDPEQWSDRHICLVCGSPDWVEPKEPCIDKHLIEVNSVEKADRLLQYGFVILSVVPRQSTYEDVEGKTRSATTIVYVMKHEGGVEWIKSRGTATQYTVSDDSSGGKSGYDGSKQHGGAQGGYAGKTSGGQGGFSL